MSVRPFVLALAVLTSAGLLAGCSSEPEKSPAQAAFQEGLARKNDAYVAEVRRTTPEVEMVSDDKLKEGALFMCAAYADVAEPTATMARLSEAADALIKYGYVPSPQVTGYQATSPFTPSQRVAQPAKATC